MSAAQRQREANDARNNDASRPRSRPAAALRPRHLGATTFLDVEAARALTALDLRQLEVTVDHGVYQFFETSFRLPA